MLSTVLFAASAAAQLTTSMWMPSSYDPSEVGFYGSVVDVKDGKTTVALQFDDDTDMDSIYVYDNTPETITIQGSTWFESVATTTERFEEGDMTYSIGCSVPARSRAKPTCTYSMGGELAYKSYCSDYSSYTDAYTSTYEYTYTADEWYPETVETYIRTVDYRTYIPEECSSGSTLPEDIAVQTVTMSRGYIETYQVVITAGEEKLSATAGSAPQGTGAQATNGTITGGTPTANAPQNTGAAAPMVTQAPLLAGLGVAAMAVFAL